MPTTTIDEFKKNQIDTTIGPLIEQANALDEPTREMILKSGESVYHMAQVLSDAESSPIEKATSVLTCLNNFSQVAVSAGGGPFAAVASACFALITKILEFFGAKPAPSMIEQVEKILREIYKEQTESKIKAVTQTVEQNIALFKDIRSNSLTTEEIERRTGFSSGVAEFTLYEVAGWLTEEKNFKVDGWEDVFVMYAYSVIQDITLHLTAVDRATTEKNPKTDEVPKVTAKRRLGIFCKQLNETLTSVHDRLLQCGDYYSVGYFPGETYGYGYRLKDIEKLIDELGSDSNSNWQDIDIGQISAAYWDQGHTPQKYSGYILAISARSARIWANRYSGLFTGYPGSMNKVEGIQFCSDIGLVPGLTAKDSEKLLVVTSDGRLHVNEWIESGKRLLGEFWSPQLEGSGRVIMARGFRALKPGGIEYEDSVYILRSSTATSGVDVPVEIQRLTWSQLLASRNSKVTPTTLWKDSAAANWRRDTYNNVWVYDYNDPLCGIAVSKNYCYFFSHLNVDNRATQPRLFRIEHDYLNGGKDRWEKINLPARSNEAKAISIRTLDAYSDDALVASVNWDQGGRGNDILIICSGYYDGNTWEWKQIGGKSNYVVRHTHDSWKLFDQLKKTAAHFKSWASIDVQSSLAAGMP